MSPEHPAEVIEFGDEDHVTDITIGADGRLYVFGASRLFLEMLDDLGMSTRSLPDRVAEQSIKLDD